MKPKGECIVEAIAYVVGVPLAVVFGLLVAEKIFLAFRPGHRRRNIVVPPFERDR